MVDTITDKWYYTVHEHCVKLSEEHGVPLIKVAAIMSVLSPNVSFKSNLNSLEKFLETGGDCTVSTYYKQKVKADNIYSASDYSEESLRGIIGSGLKTLSFFENIYRPESSESVTVDLWMIRWAKAKRIIPKSAGVQPTKKQYKLVSEAIARRAKREKVQPHEYQARVWVELRGNAF